MSARRRFADVVRSEPVDLGLACLLVGGEVDPDLDVDDGLRRLDELAEVARSEVPRRAGVHESAEGLRRALGEWGGFSGEGEDYADLRSSLLHEVGRRRGRCGDRPSRRSASPRPVELSRCRSAPLGSSACCA